MMTPPTVSYDRAPSPELQELLMPGGPLSWLVDLHKNGIGDRKFDVHFRRGDEVHVYGLPSVLTLKRLKRPKGCVKVSADRKELFRRYPPALSELRECVEAYLHDIGGKLPSGEAAIQMQWSRVTEPWTPFDREAVLGGRPGRKELDQLAVDPEGRLVLIEIKDASVSNLNEALSQLRAYIWEWHGALSMDPRLKEQLQALLDARVKVGLTSPGVAEITGRIRAVVCFGNETRSLEAKRFYDAAVEPVSNQLPAGVGSIETWAIADRKPCRVA